MLDFFPYHLRKAFNVTLVNSIWFVKELNLCMDIRLSVCFLPLSYGGAWPPLWRYRWRWVRVPLVPNSSAVWWLHLLVVLCNRKRALASQGRSSGNCLINQIYKLCYTMKTHLWLLHIVWLFHNVMECLWLNSSDMSTLRWVQVLAFCPKPRGWRNHPCLRKPVSATYFTWYTNRNKNNT